VEGFIVNRTLLGGLIIFTSFCYYVSRNVTTLLAYLVSLVCFQVSEGRILLEYNVYLLPFGISRDFPQPGQQLKAGRGELCTYCRGIIKVM
jgi:hypothetical protein